MSLPQPPLAFQSGAPHMKADATTPTATTPTTATVASYESAACGSVFSSQHDAPQGHARDAPLVFLESPEPHHRALLNTSPPATTTAATTTPPTAITTTTPTTTTTTTTAESVFSSRQGQHVSQAVPGLDLFITTPPPPLAEFNDEKPELAEAPSGNHERQDPQHPRQLHPLQALEATRRARLATRHHSNHHQRDYHDALTAATAAATATLVTAETAVGRSHPPRAPPVDSTPTTITTSAAGGSVAAPPSALSVDTALIASSLLSSGGVDAVSSVFDVSRGRIDPLGSHSTSGPFGQSTDAAGSRTTAARCLASTTTVAKDVTMLASINNNPLSFLSDNDDDDDDEVDQDHGVAKPEAKREKCVVARQEMSIDTGNDCCYIPSKSNEKQATDASAHLSAVDPIVVRRVDILVDPVRKPLLRSQSIDSMDDDDGLIKCSRGSTPLTKNDARAGLTEFIAPSKPTARPSCEQPKVVKPKDVEIVEQSTDGKTVAENALRNAAQLMKPTAKRISVESETPPRHGTSGYEYAPTPPPRRARLQPYRGGPRPVSAPPVPPCPPTDTSPRPIVKARGGDSRHPSIHAAAEEKEQPPMVVPHHRPPLSPRRVSSTTAEPPAPVACILALEDLCSYNGASASVRSTLDVGVLVVPALRAFLPPLHKVQLPQPSDITTAFHSSTVPDLPLLSYAARLAHAAFADDDIMAAAVVLALRWQRATQIPITSFVVHRLLAACVLLAAKTLSDFFPTNDTFATGAGLAPQELFGLEMALLADLQFSASVSWREVATLQHMALVNKRTHAVAAVEGSVDAAAVRGGRVSLCLATVVDCVGPFRPV